MTTTVNRAQEVLPEQDLWQNTPKLSHPTKINILCPSLSLLLAEAVIPKLRLGPAW
jgi:hypothetical protein